MMGFAPRRTILILFLCAFALRLGFFIGVVGLHGPLRGDEVNYQDHATNLAAGKGFIGTDGHPTAARPPLFPVIVGSLYRVFGVHLEAARIFQILLGVAIVALSYLLARKIFSAGTALLAAALVTVNPYLIFISSYVLTENLYTALLLAGLLLLVWGRERQFASRANLVAAGFVFGLASLTRPNAVVLVVLIVPAIFAMAAGNLLNRITKSLILVLAVILAVTPWALRNHAKLGHWVFFTTHGGITFYQSNNQLVYDDPSLRGSVAPRESLPGWEKLQGAREVEGDREAWRMGKTYLREHPRLIPRLVLSKFIRFWRLRSHAPWSGVKGGWWWNKNRFLGGLASKFDFGVLYAIFVIPCFLLGLVVTRGDYRKLYLLYATILVHTFVALAFYGSLRARIPIEPVISILAAAGMVYIGTCVRSVRHP